MPKVSVIVPIYNTEKYLHRCIDSILGQTFTDFELILVDDGSTDKSGKICDEYAKKDSRIVVVHKENGGVSSARNNGLDIAHGEWITFVDSDDYISDNMLSSFDIEFEDNSDMKIGTITSFGYNANVSGPTSDRIISIDDLSLHTKQLNIQSPCSKLYKVSIIKNFKIYFDKNIRVSEDLLFNIEVLLRCSYISLHYNVSYYYDKSVEFSSKHYLRVDELQYNLNKITIAINSFEKSTKNKYTEIKQGVYLLQYFLFTNYINKLDKKGAIKQLKKYRKYKLYKYKFKMNYKERICQYLWYTFPKFMYLFFK